MRRARGWIGVFVVLAVAVSLFAESVEWSRIGYKRQGMLIQTPTGETLPVSIPGGISVTGGATEVTQLIIKGYIQQLRDGTATETTLAQVLTALQQLKFTGENLKVYVGNTSIPVTGTFWQSTQPISAASLPLPTGAALESGGNLATVKTNTDPLVTAGGGGYVRQDSTATIAKETGGNLADIKTALTDSTITETMVVIEMTTKDTEYSYTLPANTIYFFARESSGARDIRYSSLSGQTADDGVYQTIYAKEAKESPFRSTDKIGAKTLYFRDKTNDATRVILEIWTK